jgi:hypothetical protein
MANIQKRNLNAGNNAQDEAAIANFSYSQSMGGVKVGEVGKHLLPLPTPTVGNGYTTNPSTAYALPGAGKNLAVYNSSGTVAAITFGTDNTVTALAAGATDSSGRVGLPCAPNQFSYFASGYNNWVISGSSSLLVFIIDDQTSIQVQAAGLQNNYGFPGTQP